MDNSNCVSQQDVVLLIHGTGAADTEDIGTKWWQAGSKFCTIVDRDIGEKARCNKEKEVFHWSGSNSESKRRQAGRDLYLHLQEKFEQQKTNYHLIAHSHGGAVIWYALCESLKQRKPLTFLKSWSTAGAPFFQYRVKIFDILLVIPFFISFLVLMHILQNYLWLFFPGLRLSWQQIDKTAAPVMVFFCFLLLSICLFSGFKVWTTLQSMFSEKAFKQLGKQVAQNYSHCWLNLYSQNDEAIIGLTNTLDPAHNLIPRKPYKQPSILLTILWFPIVLLYNISAFVIDSYTWNKIKRGKGFQGNDIDGLELDKVGWPYLGACENLVVPLDIDQQMVDWANNNIKQIINPLRESLNGTAIFGDFPRVTRVLAGKEMVHSSYYQLEVVILLLSKHIKKYLEHQEREETFADTNLFEFKKSHRKQQTNLYVFQVAYLLILVATIVILWLGATQFYTTQLRAGILRGIPLKQANLSSLNLVGAKLNKADLSEANFANARLNRADLSETDMWEAQLSFVDLRNANLNLTNLEGANLSEGKLQEADLSGANLRETDFSGANLDSASLNFTSLQNANFTQASLGETYFWSADLSEAVFHNAYLMQTKFFYATLHKADFRNADLTNANLSGADLSGANLSNANLCGAIFDKANLSGANLTGANLSATNFNKAILINTNMKNANFNHAENLTKDQISKCKNAGVK